MVFVGLNGDPVPVRFGGLVSRISLLITLGNGGYNIETPGVRLGFTAIILAVVFIVERSYGTNPNFPGAPFYTVR